MTGYFKSNSNIARPRGTLNDYNVYFFFPFLFTAELFLKLRYAAKKKKGKATLSYSSGDDTDSQCCCLRLSKCPIISFFLSFLFFFCSISRFLFPSEMFTHILAKWSADRLLYGLNNRSVENPISTTSNQTTTTEGVEREVYNSSRVSHMTHYSPRGSTFLPHSLSFVCFFNLHLNLCLRLFC